ncbi:MAG: tetratricopeptide repeat protein [Akkermansiaceae bacterium]|nr:tetratricopeptide repeat protein [Akkermansiaceae bacterium]
MKHSITTLLLALALHFTLAPQSFAQDETDKTDPGQEPIVGVWRDFMNLPKQQREDYGQKLIKVQNLFNQKRIFDALEKIDELDKIFKDHPAALNIKGACYVEIRAFDKANAIFEQVLAISPNNTNVQFNLAEVDFVTKNWEKAYERFSKLIPLLPAENKAMIRLCEFKLLLCQLKTDRVKEALVLQDKYDAWDDSPFYYYSRAAILYHHDDKLEAEKMLRNARFVWQNDAALAAWQDTLIEFGYIRSFYGGDAGEEE